jgi:tetratricopeptide (TPR) repeat protein
MLGAMAGIEEAERALAQADEAYASFDVERAVVHLSAAVRGFTAADDRCRAAMACVRLGDVMSIAMGNLTAGRAWFTRAARLLEDEPPCIEQGWVAVAAMGCDVDDPDVLLARATLALERARRFGDVNLETKALADAGLAHVQAGRVVEGMALLDEAMALACGPADDVTAAARSVCSFFTACYHAADFERAGSWTELLRRQGLIGSTPGSPIFLSSHCDSVQATLLVELGQWGTAEATLTRAKQEFEAVMAGSSWHPDIFLADLRVLQGRLAEAEALVLGKDQAIEALLPAARLHHARGEHDLARAAARRGLRAVRDDRLRAVALLAVLVDAELAAGDLEAAQRAAAEIAERTAGVDVPALQARAIAARARVQAAAGDLDGAIAALEAAVDELDVRLLPWRRACLLVELARVRDEAGDLAGAALDAARAMVILAPLDVVLAPGDAALLERLAGARPGEAAPGRATTSGSASAELVRDGKWWVTTADGARARLPDTKGLRYLAELIARPGTECHALDLVDRVEGVAAEGVDRRALGDAGALLDARARAAYRHRVEALRGEIEDLLASGDLDAAEARQAELDALVAELARAFGLGGRDRRAASAAERARLNVTRALRAAIIRLTEALPDAGRVLDRRVRTGLYCSYTPDAADEFRWVVRA